jgi:hypothetical protein
MRVIFLEIYSESHVLLTVRFIGLYNAPISFDAPNIKHSSLLLNSRQSLRQQWDSNMRYRDHHHFDWKNDMATGKNHLKILQLCKFFGDIIKPPVFNNINFPG